MTDFITAHPIGAAFLFVFAIAIAWAVIAGIRFARVKPSGGSGGGTSGDDRPKRPT